MILFKTSFKDSNTIRIEHQQFLERINGVFNTKSGRRKTHVLGTGCVPRSEIVHFLLYEKIKKKKNALKTDPRRLRPERVQGNQKKKHTHTESTALNTTTCK